MSNKLKFFHIMAISGITLVSLSGDVLGINCAARTTTCSAGLAIDNRAPACGAFRNIARDACILALYVKDNKKDACDAGFNSCNRSSKEKMPANNSQENSKKNR